MNIVLIYPEDPTITFLDPICNELIRWTKGTATIIKTYPNQDSIDRSLYQIERLPKESIIIFMGHGASNLLHVNVQKEEVLMDLNIAKRVFLGKKLISISCRSSEFIHNIGLLNSGLGFGHLPTEFDDIAIEIEAGNYKVEPFSVAEITKRFNFEFVSIILGSLEDFYFTNGSLSYLKRRIILRTNLALDSLKNNIESERLIGNLLFDMKRKISVFEN